MGSLLRLSQQTANHAAHKHHLHLVHTVYFLLMLELLPACTSRLILHARQYFEPLLNIIRRSEDTGSSFLELQLAVLLDLCTTDLPQSLP